MPRNENFQNKLINSFCLVQLIKRKVKVKFVDQEKITF